MAKACGADTVVPMHGVTSNGVPYTTPSWVVKAGRCAFQHRLMAAIIASTRCNTCKAEVATSIAVAAATAVPLAMAAAVAAVAAPAAAAAAATCRCWHCYR